MLGERLRLGIGSALGRGLGFGLVLARRNGNAENALKRSGVRGVCVRVKVRVGASVRFGVGAGIALGFDWG